ncbi:DUF2924 domain-containing protein, partial [Wolbachia endosymbiont of Drosophila bocki]|uniref:DUF2924 domain-containing protein n=1 Tax=Wolbachia endosymbiont of Drosophila bocki TaxID=3002576 RepID=UPI0023A97B01
RYTSFLTMLILPHIFEILNRFLERGEETHAVMVTDKGLIYREEFFTSLSAVARKIMGMSYNGPLLFGMRDKNGS